MKKKWYYLIITVIILINVIVCAYVLNKLANDPALNETQEYHSTMKNSDNGTNDGNQTRAEYEFMRQHDPMTGLMPKGIRSKELVFAAKLPKKYARENSNERSKHITSQTWIQRGPFNVGGRTRALGIDVSNENRILAGGVSGGMWISTDIGATWTQTTALSQLHSVSCLSQDIRPNHQNVWYYGTGESDGNSAGIQNDPFLGDGIFKSVDSGLTWVLLPATAADSPQTFNNSFDYVWKVAIYPNDTIHDVVFAATYGHIYRSMDGGITWNSVLGIPNNASSYSHFDISPKGIIYAALSSDGTTKGIFRSADSGTTWTNIIPATFPLLYHRTMLAVAPTAEDTVYVISETPNFGKLGHNLWRYVYISGDGSGAGGSWTNLSQSIPNLGGNGAFSSQGSYDLYIKVKPDNDSTVFLGGTDIYRSTNGFNDTTTTAEIGGYNLGTTNPLLLGVDESYTNHHPDQHALEFFPSNPNKMITGDDGGVQRTLDNTAATVAWIKMDNGYMTSQFYTIAVDHATVNDPIIVGGLQDNGNFFTNNTSGTVPWLQISGADGTYSAIADGKAYYYGSVQGGVTGRLNISNTGVINPLTLAEIDPAGGSGYLFVNPFLLDPNNSNRMYFAGGTCVWRNDNLPSIAPGFAPTSTAWTKMTHTTVSGYLSALGAGKNSDVLYYGSSTGQVFRVDNPDVGNPTPVNIWSGKGLPPGAYVSSIAVDPDDGAEAIATFSNYNIKSIYYTNDAGNTWNSISGNLEEHPDGSGDGPSVRWASIIPTQDSVYYFVGTSTGLYSTTKLNGDSTVWTQEGADIIGNVVVDYLDYRQLDGLVVAATHGNGVFSTNLPNPSGIPNIKPNANLSLGNAYPNPFSSTTTINVSLNNAATVSLKIMDIYGKEITMLENKTLPSGNYNYVWDGRNSQGFKVSDGIYYATLISNGNIATTKIALMK